MSSFNKPTSAPVTVAATTSGTATKVFATNDPIRVGYSVCNPSPTLKLYVQEVPAGDDAPTAAEIIADPSFIVQPEGDRPSGARDQTDVYCAAASALDAKFQELV